MTEVLLNEAVADTRLRHVNFFNGRLLTAEALLGEQQAQAARDALLARSIGFGVVEGLAVSGESGEKSLTITSGLGLSRSGEMVSLREDIKLLLLQEEENTATRGFGRISCNRDLGKGAQIELTEEFYLLVGTPVVVPSKDRAPRLGGDASSGSCVHDRNAAGVRFSIKPLAHGQGLDMSDHQKQDKGSSYWRMRAELADACLAMSRQLPNGKVKKDSFSSPDQDQGLLYGIEHLFGVTDRELPLALMRWQKGVLSFVDMWAARRGLARSSGGSLVTPVANDMREQAAQARLRHFQELIAEIADSDIKQPQAKDLFDRLPAAGFLPQSIDPNNFFKGNSFKIEACEEKAELRRWLHDSYRREPVATDEINQLILIKLDDDQHFFSRCETLCCSGEPLELKPTPPNEEESKPTPGQGSSGATVIVKVGITDHEFTEKGLQQLREKFNELFVVNLDLGRGEVPFASLIPVTSFYARNGKPRDKNDESVSAEALFKNLLEQPGATGGSKKAVNETAGKHKPGNEKSNEQPVAWIGEGRFPKTPKGRVTARVMFIPTQYVQRESGTSSGSGTMTLQVVIPIGNLTGPAGGDSPIKHRAFKG